MTTMETEIDQDAGDRLVKMYPGRPWFHKAARLAGQQLEWLMPVAMGPARNGGKLYAGKVVMMKPRFLVIVCSRENKLCTVQLKIEAGATAKQALDEISEIIEQRFPKAEFTFPSVAAVMRAFINKFGAKPGKAHTKYPDGFGEMVFSLIGPPLSAMGASYRADLSEKIERCFAAGICPAVVYLIGRAASGAKGGYSFGVSFLPMGPYADSVLEAGACS